MRRISLVLLVSSVGCAGTTSAVAVMSPAPTTVNVAVNITVGSPLIERDVRLALAQHGRWQSTSLGELWIPAVAEREEFTPFVTHGQWVQSAQGPQWSSVFSWGPIVFHYGRWTRVGSTWAWRFDRAYVSVPVSWRRSGAYVGWSALGMEEWCWLSFEELYAPMPWRTVTRGRSAAPIAATSRDVSQPAIELAGGWLPPGGAQSSPDTTRGSQHLEAEPRPDRWATVVIRDESAEERFGEVAAYEQVSPSASAQRTSNTPVTPVASARANAALTRAPSTSQAPTSALWGDQERLRAPLVANIQPRFSPHAMTVRVPVMEVQPAAPTSAPMQAQPAPNEPAPRVASTPIVVPQGGGGALPAGTPVGYARVPVATVTPAVTPATPVIPSSATISAGSRLR